MQKKTTYDMKDSDHPGFRHVVQRKLIRRVGLSRSLLHKRLQLLLELSFRLMILVLYSVPKDR